MDRKLAVYCSASKGIDPKFNQAARKSVRAACSLGYTIVSGGTVKGTMGVIAEEISACGGRHVGVVPRFMESLVCDGLSEIVWTDTMDERKLRMRDGVSVALALPGGIGTLDELVGTLTVAKLGVYPGKVVALNIDGFYEPLKALLDHYVATGMLDGPSRAIIEFPESVEELTRILSGNQ